MLAAALAVGLIGSISPANATPEPHSAQLIACESAAGMEPGEAISARPRLLTSMSKEFDLMDVDFGWYEITTTSDTVYDCALVKASETLIEHRGSREQRYQSASDLTVTMTSYVGGVASNPQVSTAALIDDESHSATWAYAVPRQPKLLIAARITAAVQQHTPITTTVADPLPPGAEARAYAAYNDSVAQADAKRETDRQAASLEFTRASKSAQKIQNATLGVAQDRRTAATRQATKNYHAAIKKSKSSYKKAIAKGTPKSKATRARKARDKKASATRNAAESRARSTAMRAIADAATVKRLSDETAAQALIDAQAKATTDRNATVRAAELQRTADLTTTKTTTYSWTTRAREFNRATVETIDR